MTQCKLIINNVEIIACKLNLFKNPIIIDYGPCQYGMEPRLWIAALESGGGEAAAAGPAKQDFCDEAGPREAEKAAV